MAKTRRRRIIGAALIALAATAQAQETIFESGRHDRLRLHVVSDGSETRLVTVCLRDLAGSRQPKAFGNRQDAPARLIVPPGATRCARFEPTRHLFYFARKTGEVFEVVLITPLDLRRDGGRVLRFDWLRDGAD